MDYSIEHDYCTGVVWSGDHLPMNWVFEGMTVALSNVKMPLYVKK